MLQQRKLVTSALAAYQRAIIADVEAAKARELSIPRQVLDNDGYYVGRKQLIAFYAQIERAFPKAERIYVIQDNWSIYGHDDVLASLK